MLLFSTLFPTQCFESMFVSVFTLFCLHILFVYCYSDDFFLWNDNTKKKIDHIGFATNKLQSIIDNYVISSSSSTRMIDTTEKEDYENILWALVEKEMGSPIE